MAVFGKYSRYYDLLYRDKNYRGEAEHVTTLVQRYRPGARSMLELGCGSGGHAAFFGELGYDVHGVDISQTMLDEANARRARLPEAIAQRLQFSPGDVRTVRVGRKFDCVLSLFHVMSYQPTNADVKAELATAREHLNSGGVFLFDVWYGPAVLTDRPTRRVKHMQDDAIEVERIAEPVWHPNECWVDVNYDVAIKDRASGAVEKLHESHRMRYFFKPEIELFAESAGFKVEYAGEWMTEKTPDASTWGVCFVLRVI